jgi:hypothetical protein
VDPVRVANGQSGPGWESESSPGAGGVTGQRAAASLAGEPEDTLESETRRRSPEERTCHAGVGQSDVGPCGTIQGTRYVTGDRCPNEHLLVWEPVRVGR